ncbi:hypothetical protein KUA25_23210, partial [Bacteroidales bacterium MSK.15.36]|nr:hypothetical protein [Bacteroidales bacterium MSK.15.36]
MILKCVTTYDVDKGHIDEINDRMKIGIPYVVEASSLENHPLGRMEWTKFMAAFYNKEDIADKHMQKAEDTVKKVSEKVKGKENPLVTAGMPYKG